MSGPTREQVAQWAREARVDLNFTMYPSGPIGSFRLDEFMRMMSAAYYAGRADERTEMPPAPLAIENPDVVSVVAVAVAAEREAIIKDAIDQGFIGQAYAHDFAVAIRARGAA